jgi:protein-S-isoprenylcysteine O-methyltransferase Ste14
MALVMGLVLFGASGTLSYVAAWVYLALFCGLAALVTIDVMRRDPTLLERRKKGGPSAEPRPQQRWIMIGASIGFVALLVVPALDRRCGWSHVPTALVVLGDLLFVVGFGFVGRVYRENTFGAATVEIVRDQRVISTGPYAVVRHPMYASALVYLFGTPLALGSYWGLLALAFMLPFLIARLFDEERLLAKELPGYTDYMARVRFRIVPGIW